MQCNTRYELENGACISVGVCEFLVKATIQVLPVALITAWQPHRMVLAAPRFGMSWQD